MKQLIVMAFLLLTNYTFAESAATVLFVNKKVVAKRSGAERPLSRGSSLNAGDEIITSDGALANIQYTNGALVNIGSRSNYKILAYAPKQSDVQIKAELTKGKIEIKTPGKIKETLKTPITSLAILGTDVQVYVSSPKNTYIRVIEGLVLSRNEYLRPGDSVRVTGDRIVHVPFPKEGVVGAPINAPGSISSSTTNTTSITETIGSGADSVSLLSTTLIIGTSTTDSTQAAQIAAQNMSMADIALNCVF